MTNSNNNNKDKDDAVVANFGDHEIITPPNKLRKAVVAGSGPIDDPVARAEEALAILACEFDAWMEAEMVRLDGARQDVREQGFNPKTQEALFHAAHDIKGQAATFGFPAVADVADSLCRLIEHTPDHHRIPMALVGQHVDAVRAIIREVKTADADMTAAVLAERLRQVTDDFIAQENLNNENRNNENRDRLGVVDGPPIVPGQ
jgi:HPt (histidine-containing phosphotransfer) domain-containing protein